MDFYYSVKQESQSQLVEKGSKFIAYAIPVTSSQEAQEKLSSIKALHPKARHWCFAWKIGFPVSETRSSDDGEPSGTAGRPLLQQIERKQLTNILVVVVRYFGGVLLGTGGLLKAYKESARSCLDQALIIKHEKQTELRIESNPAKIQMLLSIMKEFEVPVKSFEIGEISTLLVEFPTHKKADIMRKVKSKMEKTNLNQVEDIEHWKDCRISFKEL